MLGVGQPVLRDLARGLECRFKSRGKLLAGGLEPGRELLARGLEPRDELVAGLLTERGHVHTL